MASSSDSEKEWRAPDKKEDQPSQPKGSGSETAGSEVRVEGSVATGSEKGAQGSRVETAGSAPKGPGVPLQPPPPQEPKTPPQEPEEVYVEVTVEAEPTPPKVAPKGRGSPVGKGHLKGSIGKQSVGRVKGKGPKAAAIGKLDSSMPKVKGAVNLVPKGVRKVHLKPRPDSLKSNPPLGRRWSAYPRKRKGKQQKAPTQNQSTQTPEIMTVMGHAERHEKLEEEAKSFAQLLERHGSTNQYEARFPQVDLSIAAGRTSRSHHPCDGGDHGQDQLYKPVAGSSSAPASSSAAGCDNGGACRDNAGITQQLLFGDGTRGTEDARCRNGSPGDACGSILTANNDLECRQEGKDGGTRRKGDGYGIGFGTGISSPDQVGTNNGQGVLPGRAQASSWSFLGRSVMEGEAPRPCAAAAFISPLPPAASAVGSASCLPVATATARDRSHSAAVAKRIAAGVEELGSEGPVEEGSCEGQVEQGSGVSPWMLAGDAAYLSKSEQRAVYFAERTCLAIPHTLPCHL